VALSKDEQAQLDALTKKASEPDDDDFSIEIWDETGAGAKVPYHKGKSWLQRFGIDMPETPEAEPDETKPPAKPRAVKSADESGHASKYFGKPKAS
jgi:hypothetical protein